MNKYTEMSNNTRLSGSAKQKIYDNVLQAATPQNKHSHRRKFDISNKFFKFATVCAAAFVLCGAAIGVGVYYGTRGGDDDGSNIVFAGDGFRGTSPYYTYSTAYEYVDTDYDLDNVKIKVYYSFNEELVKKRYAEIVKFGHEISKTGENEIIDYSIYLRAVSGMKYGYGANLSADYARISEIEGANMVHIDNDETRDLEAEHHSVVLDRITIDDIDKFPFEDYAMTEVIEKDEYGNDHVVERAYTHSIEVTLPRELFDGNIGGIMFQMYDVTEYKKPFSYKGKESSQYVFGYDESTLQFFYGGLIMYNCDGGSVFFGRGGESVVLYNKMGDNGVALSEKSVKKIYRKDEHVITSSVTMEVTVFDRFYYTYNQDWQYAYSENGENPLLEDYDYYVITYVDYVNARKPISR